MNNLITVHVQRMIETRTVKLKKWCAAKEAKKDMQSNGPAILIQHKMSKKQIVPQEEDKNCQATISYKKQMKCEYDDFESQSRVKMCSDKSCQENINMQPVIPEIMNLQLPKPAVLYTYRGLCSGKNCHSTRCYSYKKRNYDKNCQFANMM